jgi:phosphomannomutase/phosphoglucomutase
MVPLRADAEAVPGRAPDFREAVAGTRVEVWGWSEARGLFARERLPWLAAFYGAALLGLALALWLPRRALKRALSADLDALVATVADAVAKRPPRMVRNRLAELQATQEQVRRQLRDLPPARVVQPRPAPDLAALAGELDSEESRELELDFGDGLAHDEPLDLAPDGGAGTEAQREEAGDEAEPVDAGVDRMPALSDAIFRAYDIRGLIDTELDADVMLALGRALGSESIARDSTAVVVGRDQRPSSQALCQALVTGLRQTGVDVIDLGIAPTPVVYFACGLRPGTSAAIVTASHNPAAYNGLKVVLAGVSATTDDIAVLRRRIHGGLFETGSGDYREESILDAYVEAVERDIAIARGLSLVIDCGHATASLVAPALFRALGCDVIELDCDCDPTLADAHMPDPAQPRNLYALGDAVRNAGADLGLAFDADGDRLGVVDSAGHAIPADRVLMLLAADLLARQPGSDIVYDVKCSHHLGAEILRHGGRPVMWKSGHTHLKQKLRECGAPLAGEYTGHYMFAERWSGFDDGFYAAGRVLEVLALDPRPSSEVFAELPSGLSTPELFVPLPAAETRGVMDAVLGMADRLDGVDVNTIDGLRADFDQGWGLVRSSNTQNGLTFRFEADDKASLDKIQDLFRRMMDLAAPRLQLPF